MPFRIFRRGGEEPEPSSHEAATPSAADGTLIRFDGLTEEWRLVGTMHLSGRLSDALNKRGSITISDVSWGPIDGSAPLEPAPGLRSVDPYDLIAVMTGQASLPLLTEAERAAHKVHKVPYDVALDAPPFRIVGTVFLYPGAEPERLLDRATELFVPVTDGAVYLGEQPMSDAEGEVVLVNRSYLRGVHQVDRRTNAPVRPLPGQPLGGVSWTDRSR